MDDTLTGRGGLAYAAACLALPPTDRPAGLMRDLWPFDDEPPPEEWTQAGAGWEHRRAAELGRASALIDAEIQRVLAPVYPAPPGELPDAAAVEADHWRGLTMSYARVLEALAREGYDRVRIDAINENMQQSSRLMIDVETEPGWAIVTLDDPLDG